MQNRSYSPSKQVTDAGRPLEFLEIRYPPDLAAHAYRYRQGDQPITRLHRHQSIELGLCLCGSGVFIIEGKTFSYHAGDLCVISEAEGHLASSAPGSSSDWIFLNFDPRALCAETLRPDQLDTSRLCGPGFCNIFPGEQCPPLAEAIQAFLREFEEKREGYPAAVRALGAWMLVLLHRLPTGTPEIPAGKTADGASPPERRAILQRLEPALEAIARNYMAPLGLEDLARGCNLSAPHFRRLFREALGCAPLEYLIRWRVRMAAALLTGSLPPGETDQAAGISDLALRCGFNSLSAFNRHFKRLTGDAPRDFRRRPAADRRFS